MHATDNDLDLATNDLGPLAWVLDELRKSLDTAAGALRRFVRDTGLARGSDMASVDGGHLRIARQQLHQAVGALEMVGLPAPAHMLRCMEAAVQRFVDHPDLCNEPAAAKLERAGFALTEFLEGVLLGKAASAVALFPQYRDVQELAGADRIHPADLWELQWRWQDPDTPALTEPSGYEPPVRSRMDQAVLRLVKSADPAAARELADLSLSLAAGQSGRQPRIFWKISAAFFEAVSLRLLRADVYLKRAASRILLQYASLAKGEVGVSDRLAQDLVFLCSQAAPAQPADAPVLAAVRLAWGLARFTPVDYETAQFGRFDPAMLAQARKRIGSAKESWAALSGGDASKLKPAADQFHHLGDLIVKFHPQSGRLAQALSDVIDTVVRTGRPPGPEVAMEVATAVLYLEAAFQDLDPSDNQMATRAARLAERLERVGHGGQPEALEPWMEELYRRVSDRQTMGSVVSELRATMGELEKLLDQFFRTPQDKAPLRDAPAHLSQMRGVLSVLGLEQAAQAVHRMRDAVEEVMVTEVDEERARAAGTFDKLGNNLGALGFLIDMLNYQPALAKKLFVYDEATGELRPLMGRATAPVPVAGDPPAVELSRQVRAVVQQADPQASQQELTATLDALAAQAVLAEQAQIAQSAREAAAAVAAQDSGAAAAALSSLAAAVQLPTAASAPAALEPVEEGDLRDIFLEEAREVVHNGLAAVEALAAEPADVNELTTLRRAFHTLKGSSRMVGLSEFGDAAWSMEQVLNTWLADQKAADDDLLGLSADAMRGFARWIEDIAAGRDSHWKPSMFRGAADSLRLEHRRLPLPLPLADSPPTATGANVALPAAGELAGSEPARFEVAASVDVPPDLELELDLPVVEDRVPAATDAAALSRAEPGEPLHGADIPAGEPPFEFDFDLPPLADLPASSVDHPSRAAPAAPVDLSLDLNAVSQGVPSPQLLVEPAQGQDQDQPALPDDQERTPPASSEFTIDLAELEAVSDVEPIGAAPEDVAPASALAEAHDIPLEFEAGPGLLPETAMADEAAQPMFSLDEQVKVIGSLRIGIPLYNVFLNEADEWSRRLATEVGEWALELTQPLPDSAVGLAHALAGSSATVGFHALSEIARALESTMMQAQKLAFVTPQHGKAFTEAAEEIRRLLHQFAAGFLKDPDPAVVANVLALRELDLPVRADLPEPPDSAFDDFEPELQVAPPSGAKGPVREAGEDVLAPQTPASQTADERPLGELPEPAPTVVAVAFGRVGVHSPADAEQVHSRDEADLDLVDAIDPDLFPIFEDEAAELMPQLGGALRQWAARPENRSARDEVLRGLHTLKGSARLAGALRLGELAHRMESEVESLGSDLPAPSSFDGLLQRFDGMQATWDTLKAGGGRVLGAGDLDGGPVYEEDALQVTTPAQSQPPALEASRALLARPASTPLASQRASANQSVRVRSQLLDRLVNQAGEVMMTRSRLEAELGQLRSSLADLTGNLDRLRSQLRDIELQAESQMQSRLAQAKDSAAGFDPLEFDRFTRVQELTRMMAESVNDVATVQRNLQRTIELTEDDLVAQARQTRELQRDLLRTRMVEFESISDRLYRVIRLASKETAKQVKLDITGGSIEMDRGVLDRMTPAFEHLLRNCVAHGVEAPEARASAGKDPAGRVLIGLNHEGNDVSVEFRDDGAGLDLVRIRRKALQQGLIGEGQALSDQEAANLIFMPGFSTASEVTELAGRGIGMDVVRAEVNALGGRIETSSEPGQGTRFKLVLPLTTAVTQVVMVRSGKLSIGVPSNLVELVQRAAPDAVQQGYDTGTYEFGGEQLPFYWLGALLQASARSSEPQGRTVPVVIFRSAAQRIAVHVDEVLGNQEVVVKNLGPQLARLPGLAGMTVLASGAVVLIYNPVALMAVYGQQARRLSADQPQPGSQEQDGRGELGAPPVEPGRAQIPLVLVVDDSITVRRVTQRLLQREGYRVSLATDGLQALERLAEEKPAVVLSDIEMPRMDGFDLARNIRGDARMARLPIIMITSRIAPKHREHAKELGVDHYLGKPYSEEELLSLIKHYSTPAIAA
jgi:chemosensory pili system protein ChpA (sensor histidine kinase/response regulator)